MEGWQDGSPQAVIDSVRADVTKKTGVLRVWSPETGAYFNEADSNELDWQRSFFGDNYEKLLAVKEEIDPENVLWCKKCVGSEVFAEQGNGRLCKAWSKDHNDGKEDMEDEKSELRR